MNDTDYEFRSPDHLTIMNIVTVLLTGKDIVKKTNLGPQHSNPHASTRLRILVPLSLCSSLSSRGCLGMGASEF